MILHQPTLTFLSEQRWRVVWIRKDQIKKAKYSQEEIKCLTKPDLDQIQMKRNKTTEFNVFPENPCFLKFSLCSLLLWAPLQTDEKKILAPCLVNHPHLHFNRSSFKFWEISNNPGTFSEFLQRSDAKILSRISPSWKMICTTMHAFPLKENLSSPALKMHSKCWTFYQIDLNSPWWGIGRGENWIWNQNWRPAGQPHSINLIKPNCKYIHVYFLPFAPKRVIWYSVMKEDLLFLLIMSRSIRRAIYFLFKM